MSDTITQGPEIAGEQAKSQSNDLTVELQNILDQANQEREHYAHYSERARAITKHIEPDPDSVAKYFGVDNELAQGAINDAELIRPGVRIAHRTSDSQFSELLHDGRFKNFTETGRGGAGGEFNADSSDFERRSYEEANNLRKDDDPTIIHGYLEDLDTIGERGEAFSYGPVELVFKSKVMERSVYTDGDSGLTRTAPIDLDTALISKALRDRKHQRPGLYNKGDGYTEAMILGGVTMDDVEEVVIDTAGQQTAERESENTVPKTPEEIEQRIQDLHAAKPNLKLAFKIPAETFFPTAKVLELAKKYPDVQFIATVRDLHDNGVPSPFRALGTAESTNKLSPSQLEERASLTEQEFTTAAERRDYLVKRTAERWEQEGNETPVPANISFTLNNKRY